MSLPEPFGAWIRQLLNADIPAEQSADCLHCPMCPPENGAASSANAYFNPVTKCCTYLPELPNFIVGYILNDDSEKIRQGRSTVEQRIAQGINVTPLGLGIPADYVLKYKNSPDSFGHATTMMCPHFSRDSRTCGIWQHRSAVCLSWHCKYDRGARGRAFWHQLHNLLNGIQYSLSLWCVQKLELSSSALKTLFQHLEDTANNIVLDRDSIDHLSNPILLDRVWEHWRGRELDFYRKCAQFVSALEWSDVENICGPELALHAQLLQDAFQHLVDQNIPEQLHTGIYQVIDNNQNTVKVVTYNSLDPLELPHSVLTALPQFNRHNVIHALDVLSREQNIPISSSTLRTLIDFELLVEPD